MSREVLLSEIFKVRKRFHRSINIVHDKDEVDIIDGYILTDLGKSILNRIALSLGPDKRARSWSITGPYGAGKSAFSLFLVNLLKSQDSPEAQRARDLLRNRASLIHQRMFAHNDRIREQGMYTITINGSRSPITNALMDALDESISDLAKPGSRIAHKSKEAGMLRNESEKEAISKPEEVIQMLSEFKDFACKDKGYAGVLLIIDELGKFLEYSVKNHDEGDIFVLQSLAEFSNRTDSEPLLLVTMLHQAFDRYATSLSITQQNEWAKVQGRFEDIPFIDTYDQILSLLGNAIERYGELDGFHTLIEEEADKAVSLKLAPSNMNEDAFRDAIRNCAPIHPIVALILGPLFKSKLAQNERSLFAFLTSSEPDGFYEFLRNNNWSHQKSKPFYRLSNLYEYVTNSLGSSLFVGSQGKRWMEIDEALNRLSKDAQAIEYDIIKSIGLLGILGDKRFIKPSREVLYFALIDKNQVKKKDVDQALDKLTASKIIIYRKHLNAFSVWEGCDIDFEDRFKQGLARIEKREGIAQLIGKYIEPAPIIAKKHMHRTGNFRYFKPEIIDASELKKFLGETKNILEADGQVVFIIPGHNDQVEEIAEYIKARTRKGNKVICRQSVYAIVGNINGVYQTLEEVLAWEWVKNNTPDMEGDRVAQKEYLALYDDAKQRLKKLCEEFYNQNYSFRNCVWIYKGKEEYFNSARKFSEYFSSVLAPRKRTAAIERGD